MEPDKLKELESQAQSTARGAMRSKQNISKDDLAVIIHGVCRRLKYDKEQWKKEKAADDKQEENDRYDSELRLLISKTEFQATLEETAWKLIEKNFVPVDFSSGEVLQDLWKHKFQDELTGENSPSVLEVLKNDAFALANDIRAFADPKAFVFDITQKCCKHDYFFRHIFSRAGDQPDFEARFGLRAARFPPQ